MAKEVESYSPNPKEIIGHEIDRDPVLIPEHGVTMQLLSTNHLEIVADHYRRAYMRGDFFAGRYVDPRATIFNPEWFEGEISNHSHTWVVFSRYSDFLGATGLFLEDDAIRSDETQIDINGRGLRIMTHFFRRIIPQIEQHGLDLVTEFVLTQESKGLRKTLQAELGMKALGILPHTLCHTVDDHCISEIPAAKYHHLNPGKVIIVETLEPLYRIIAEQFTLDEPEVIPQFQNRPYRQEFTDRYQEVKISAQDPYAQKASLADGFSPVKFDPRDNTFTMAKFHSVSIDLSFIADEGISINTRLINYLNLRLLNVK